MHPLAGAPDVRTPMSTVRAMLDLAHVTSSDVVYDLGSGDGRIVIAAVRERGARGVGVEIDPALVAESRASARRLGIDGRARFVEQDIFQVDLGEATVVTLYLSPSSTSGSAPSSSPSSARGAGSSPTTSTWGTGRPTAWCACRTTAASGSCTSGRCPRAADLAGMPHTPYGPRRKAALSRASVSMAGQSPAAIRSAGATQEPPTHATFGRAR